MKIKKVIKTALAAATAVAMLAASGFAAQLDVLLKDRTTGGNYGSPESVRVQVLDGLGNMVGDKIAEDLGSYGVGANFLNLDENEPYTILSRHTQIIPVEQNPDVEVTTIGRKTVMFGEGEGLKTRDMYIGNPIASNVRLRVVGIPLEWSAARVKLTPVVSNRVSMSSSEFVFYLLPDEYRSGEIVLPSIPSGRYNWAVGDPDGNNEVSNNRTRTIRTDASLQLNVGALQTPTLTTVFKLRNADRTPAEFSGETITYVVKDLEGNIVRQNTLLAESGLEVSSLGDQLFTQGAYTLTATMSKNGTTITRSLERAFNVHSRPRTINITFEKLADINVDFIVKNSRTGAAVDAIATIKDTEGNIVATVEAVNGKISTSMIRNHRHTVEISAEGYATRTMSLTPYENHVREINLSAI